MVLQNYATGVSHACDPQVLEILGLLGKWTHPWDLVAALPHWKPEVVQRRVEELLDHTFLRSSDQSAHPNEHALARWAGWNPTAAFYHFATKDVRYLDPDEANERAITMQWHPDPLKHYEDAQTVELPAFTKEGPFPEVLLQRRTWRHFGDRRVTLNELAALLGLTWGVQMWVHTDSDRRVPFKTSPSGGARHSLEAYLLAWGVEGLQPGTYHYAPDEHALTLLDMNTPRSVLEEFLPQQPWTHRPAAVVFMTSIFERMQSKYRHPRAYRVLHLEAGHFSQTFCLVATWLGLAPFCTTALGDSAIERHLGIDGVSESVIHAVGVGSRPIGLDWAPDYRSLESPRTSPPRHEARRNNGGPGAD